MGRNETLKARHLCLSCLILAIAASIAAYGQATITMWTDPTAFEAQFPGLTTIDFASLLPTGQVLGQITGPAGVTVNGVQFQGLPTNFLYLVAPGYGSPYQGWTGNPTVLQSLAPIGTTLVVTLPPGTTAVGTDIYTIQGTPNPPPPYVVGAPVPVTVDGQPFTVPTSDKPNLAFVGFSSPTPMTKLVFYAPTVAAPGGQVGGYVNLANFEFGGGCPVNVDVGAILTMMLASFTPPGGLTLSTYASAWGFAGFDWQQTITSMPCPNKFEPYNPSALPLSDFCQGGGITATVPFSDPVKGGWTYIPVDNINVNPYPFYYASSWLLGDEQNPNNICALNNFVFGCIIPAVSSDGKTLNFYDAPADQLLPQYTFM